MKPYLIPAALLCAALLCAALPARADTTWSLGSWKATAGINASLSSGGARILEATAYEYHADKTTDLPNAVTSSGTHLGRPMDASWTWDNGILRGRFALQKRDDPEVLKKDFMVFVTFAGGDLAGTTVKMDADDVKIPPARVAGEFQHARRLTFFGDQPRRRVTLEIITAQFANLRDFRGDGRDDLQLMAFSKEGIVELSFDLRAGATPSTSTLGAGYPGQEYVANDDLHLPNTSHSRNWVQNASFEGDLSSWGEGITDTRNPSKPKPWGWNLDRTQAHSGKQSARYVVARGFNPPMLATWPVAVATGQKYTLSFWAKTDRPGVGFAQFAQSAVWGQWDERRIQLDSTSWKRYSFSFTAKNPFVRVAFGDRWWDNVAADQIDGAQIWLDDVQLEASREAAEAPSDFEQKPLLAWSETGTQDQGVALDAAQQGLTLHGVNAQNKAAAVTWRVRILDWKKKLLLERTYSAVLPAFGRWQQAIDLKPIQSRGLLRVEVEGSSGAFREAFFGRVTRFSPLDGRSSVRYAQHIEDPQPGDAGYLRLLGVGGSLGFTLPASDAVVQQLQARDWMLIAGLNDGAPSPVDVGKEAMDEAKWAKYDAWLGERIKRLPSLMYWKTLNEPNTGEYKWTPAECVRAVAIMRRHIKSVNPKALVLSPDPYNASRSGQAWLDEFFSAGGAALVDAVAIHTYRARPESPDLDEDIQALRVLMQKHKLGAKPILFTEGEGVSPYQIPEIGMSPFGGFWEWRLSLLSHDVGRSEIAAASLLQRTLLACLKNQDTVKYYLSWREDAAQNQPYASRASVNWLLSSVGKARFVRELQIGEEAKTYLFETPDKRPIAVLWSHDLKVDRGDKAAPLATIPVVPGLDARDFMGNALAGTREGNSLKFAVGGQPVFLIGPRGGTPTLAAALERAQIGAQGLRAVDITTRLQLRNGVPQLAATFTNRLLSAVSGSGTLQAGASSASKPLSFTLGAAGRSQVLAAALPNSGGLNELAVRAEFTAGGGTPVVKAETLRWLAIPRLKSQPGIDGDAADWANVPAQKLDSRASILEMRRGDAWKGAADLSAQIKWGWRSDGLYAMFAVRDDVYTHGKPEQVAWQADALQLYIDLLGNGRDKPGAAYDTDDETLFIGKTAGNRDFAWRDYTPEFQVAFVKSGLLEDARVAVKRAGDVTTYEFFLPAKQVFPLKMQAGTSFGLAFLVNDADADGERRIGLTPTGQDSEPHQRPDLWPVAILTE